ncbi:MAG: CDP-diacylglycerol--glycerol-3-phosphate 3-phosphatidyltransferase [Phycisphaerae bacterium]
MTRHVPNLLTVARFFMAIAFFIVVGFYDPRAPAGWPVLDIAFVLFLVGVSTDMVDGYIARKYQVQSTFGRIADPFVDKIIVCGALAYFIGDPFLVVREASGEIVNLAGWQPWMVVLILARELLVTGMRSFSESHGIPFAASWSGKVKMILQCTAICWTIFYVAHWTDGPAWAPNPAWTQTMRDGLIWGTVIFTAVSGLTYIQRAYHLLRLPPDEA